MLRPRLFQVWLQLDLPLAEWNESPPLKPVLNENSNYVVYSKMLERVA